MFDIFYNLFGNLLRILYDFTSSYGLSIILFTFITRIVFVYFNAKSRKSMLKMQRLQPKQKEIQEKHGNDRAKAQQEIQQMMQAEGVNPMGGCLWQIIPLPIMFVLFRILQQPLAFVLNLRGDVISGMGNLLINMGLIEGSTHTHAAITNAVSGNVSAIQDYISQIAQNGYVYFYNAYGAPHFEVSAEALGQATEQIAGFNHSFLGIDLLVNPQLASFTIIVPILAAAGAFLGAHLAQKWSKQERAANMRFMFMLMPLVSFYFSLMWPAGLGLYWIAGSVYGIGQDFILTKRALKELESEDAKKAEIEARRKAAEAAMKEEQRKRREEEYASGKKKKPTNYKLKTKPPKQKPPQDEE
ncbi:MAG: YidC/Oxa1 family membrane protein insertase [Oscillospiraceae bacterium]|nr:YidC/Oxa1 family membrane protein insertase [Oscillospiraceae bacterium]